MAWRDTITKIGWRDTIKTDWRSTIVVVKKKKSLKDINAEIKKELVKELKPKGQWKRSIQDEMPAPKDGKDFVFSEHEQSIKAILEKLVQNNKLKFADLTDEEKAQLKGEKGDSAEIVKIEPKKGKDGKDGKNGTEWHLVKGKPDSELGSLGDMALDLTSSSIYKKEDSGWVFKGKLKGQNIIAGGITTFDVEEITRPSSLTVDGDRFPEYDITTQDFIRVIGNRAVTLYLPNPAQYKKRLTIKNLTQYDVTVIQRNSTVNNQANLIIPPMGDGLGISMDLLPDSEQFWIK